MSLFQNSVLNKYLKGLDTNKAEQAWNTYKNHFHNPEIQENIRNSKEEQYQGEFLIDLFVNVFGYVKNPSPNFNLTTELKNIKGAKKTDGAILQSEKAVAVIELKGTKTVDLAKVETQAFGYKNNQPGCIYVITSNFEKLRFYIDNAVDFEEFNLFQLTKEKFDVLYLCLAEENLLKGIPKQIKDESLTREETVTKQLYKDYSQFRNEIFDNIQTKNPQYDKLTLFKKTQKLLDRFLFIFFAEDRLLLPPNSIREIVNQWTDLRDKYDEYQPLYSRFRKYFGYMNTGYEGKRYEIFAYNGGLFAPDDILDTITIDDKLLHKHTVKLSNYDFETEVSVNILGHIFEHSLTEIETIQSQLLGDEIDPTKTKRKKDGVFYTPKYITKYIVDCTVGKLCEAKKLELKISEADYIKDRKGRQTKTLKKLISQLDTYRDWLLQLNICDPACGSGAFLNQALEFLIREHHFIDELKSKVLGDSMVFSEVQNDILENNLYGVDINEESVEIAKLSLWLRTAQKGRKLTSLNNNIKCGNSLIADSEIAGSKAFDWEKEFPKVFSKGGFDIIIGNPPYVGEKGNSEIFDNIKQIPKWKDFYRRRTNLYYFFIKLGLEIAKPKGIQCLIVPREFTSADWSNKVRHNIIETSKILTMVDFNNLKIFSEAGTTSLILLHQKDTVNTDYNFDLVSLRSQQSVSQDLFDSAFITQTNINKLDKTGLKPWNFYQDSFQGLSTDSTLSDYYNISQGVVTGADRITKKHLVRDLISDEYLGRGIFILQEGIDIKKEKSTYKIKIDKEWVVLTKEEEIFIKPFLRTENLKKWIITQSNTYLIHTGSSELSGNIKNYLLQFAGVLLNRSTTISDDETITLWDFESYSLDEIKSKYSSAGAVQKIMRRKMWWMPLYERANVPFDDPKIIVNTKNMDKFTLSLSSHYSSGGGAGGQNFIYLKQESKDDIEKFTTTENYVKFTNVILNSRLIQKYISDGQYNQLSTAKIGDIPFVTLETIKSNGSFDSIISATNNLIQLHEDINTISTDFEIYVKTKLGVNFTEVVNSENFDFLGELSKHKIKLTISEESEWLKYINKVRIELEEMENSINQINRNLNQFVYELFEMKKEEIAIVENAYA